MLALVRKPIDAGVDAKVDAQCRARGETMSVALDRRLQPLRHQGLRMQQVGERPDLSHRLVDRRDDLVAETFATLGRTQPGADAHQTEACGNQMLAGGIVKLRRYALLDAILNGSKA